MLKDLEQRSDTPATKPAALSRSALWLILILTGCVLLAGGAYWWTQLAQKPVAESPSSKLVKFTPVVVQPAIAPTVDLIAAEPQPDLIASATDSTTAADKLKADILAEPLAHKAKPRPPTATVKNSVNSANPATKEVKEAKEAAVAKPSKPSSVNTQLFSKHISTDQKSTNLYRQALSFLQQGRVAEAQAVLVESLEAKPTNHDARLTLASLLVDNQRYSDARASLETGLGLAPEITDFRIALARLQIEAGDRAAAFNTLEQGLSYAKNDADYLSFYATLLQGAERHEEAISYYMAALAVNAATASPISTSTLLGLGISLQATGKLKDAQEAFMRAQTDSTLSPELSVFVTQRLKQIKQALTH